MCAGINQRGDIESVASCARDRRDSMRGPLPGGSNFIQASQVGGVHLDRAEHRTLAMEVKKFVAPSLG